MFEFLDTFDRPVTIVETGCAGEPENWHGNGCSTFLFDKYCDTHPQSRLYSVDTNREAVELCRAQTRNAEVECGDSVEFLKRITRSKLSIDLLYLDASDYKWTMPISGGQLHHINELMAILPVLRTDTLVVIDDSPVLAKSYMDECPFVEISGKGGLIAKYAMEMNCSVVFSEYQLGLTGFHRNKLSINTDKIKGLLEEAGNRANSGHTLEAIYLFRQILILTTPPRTNHQCVARSEACLFFAQIAVTQDRSGTALDWYYEAIKNSPDYVN